ncbi:hypothetical protein, partial [Nocardioides aurantiacus]|uniref:hypothetical protein n=1 Tax=Nocardioides aurantiacus TaxID=86796 RepID=UPI00403F1BC5
MTLVEVVLGIGLVAALAPVLGLVGVGLSILITSMVAGVLLVTMARSILALGWSRLLRTILPPVACATVTTVVVGLLEHEVPPP